jgi:hypothetical protein
MGVSPMSTRTVPVLGIFRNFPGRTPVGLMGKMPMLRECDCPGLPGSRDE